MVNIIPAAPEHVPAIARIMFDAFDCVSRRHGFLPEIVSPEMAAGAAESFVRRPDMFGVVAVERGEVVGHNFVQMTDAVSGIGPICVDPAKQHQGVGRALMSAVIDRALQHGPQVRLVQEAFNMTSLSLYTSLSFDVVEPLVILSVPPAADPTCRPLTMDDVPAADTLCLAAQNVSRRNELAAMIHVGPSIGVVPHGRFIGGEIVAMVIPGFFGFSAAQSADDLIAVARAGAGALPPPLQRIILPTTNGLLLREAMAAGFRCIKVMQLMAMGPYDRPSGFWGPSIAY